MHVAVFEKDKAITFLRLLKSGPATRSYGVHVGKLAGLPEEVLERATSLLEKFESGSFPGKKVAASENQLVMFPTAEEVKPTVEASWLRETLEALDINSLTPLEALNTLADLKQRSSAEMKRVGSQSKERVRRG